jgi:hypothetical protein
LKEDGKEIKNEEEVVVCVKLCRRCGMEESGRDDQKDDRTRGIEERRRRKVYWGERKLKGDKNEIGNEEGVWVVRK